MIKLFISQPMNGKTDDEILAERKEAIEMAREKVAEKFNQSIEVIDTFYTDFPEDAKPLDYLARNISDMAKADVAYFAKGWQDARGCVIEHQCAMQYGVYVFVSEFDPHKTVIGRRLDAGLFD